ncbi:MAG: hypothetical protein ABIN37_14590 [Burkholderiaceae bacterium]
MKLDYNGIVVAEMRRRGMAVMRDLPVLALLGVLSAPVLAAAPVDVANPEHFQCVGKNRFSGLAVVPTESDGDPTGVAYSAIFFDPVSGKPLIVYGPRYRKIAPLMQSFIKRHECQHANGVQDEVAANCAALLQMRALGLTAQQESRIANWLSAEGTLDPQYGGSGAMFWERTVRCAGGR